MELPCIVEYVRFRNPEGFAILSCSLNANSEKYNVELEDLIVNMVRSSKFDTFTVTVNMLKPEESIEGRQCIFVGDFFKHQKYGEQFKSEFYYQDEPRNEAGLQAYLMTLPNIKEVRSAEIIKKFGVDGTIDILNNDPLKLTEINGITEKRIAPIKKAWDRDKSLRELYLWLSRHEIGPKIGKQAYELWGHDAHKVLAENPYRLTEIRGVDFVQADQFAHQLLDDVPIDYRIRACLSYLLHIDVYKNSNLCTPYNSLKRSADEILVKCDQQNGVKGDREQYADLIPGIIRKNTDHFAAVKRANGEKKTFVYLKSVWNKEKAIAKYIHDRNLFEDKKAHCNDEDIDDAEEDLRRMTGRSITLDDCQKEAVKSAFNHKITIITGGGGTGKSTICRCIYYLAQEKGLSVRMMSPTGKAAQVLSDKTKGDASTIHRSLKLMPGEDVGKEDVMEDIVIVDEFSMVGIDTFYALMEAMSENAWGNLVLVGDSNQLPSVSPGNFLSDMMAAKCANIVSLSHIHRQDEKSYISLIANQIASGKNSDIPQDASDIKWIEMRPEKFIEMLTQAVDRFMGKHDLKDLQIMAPKYKGSCGVDIINREIQSMMCVHNKTEAKHLKRQYKEFFIGDRVIQTVNNYDKQIFNGDMGHIVDLGRKVVDPKVSDQKEDYVVVDFYGDEIMFLSEEIDELQLAWCITVHKFQGSQSPYIIFVMGAEAQRMMYKELVYTAFTRAEKYLCIYGNINMLRRAPHESIVRERYTNIVAMMKEMTENRRLLKVIE